MSHGLWSQGAKQSIPCKTPSPKGWNRNNHLWLDRTKNERERKRSIAYIFGEYPTYKSCTIWFPNKLFIMFNLGMVPQVCSQHWRHLQKFARNLRSSMPTHWWHVMEVVSFVKLALPLPRIWEPYRQSLAPHPKFSNPKGWRTSTSVCEKNIFFWTNFGSSGFLN